MKSLSLFWRSFLKSLTPLGTSTAFREGAAPPSAEDVEAPAVAVLLALFSAVSRGPAPAGGAGAVIPGTPSRSAFCTRWETAAETLLSPAPFSRCAARTRSRCCWRFVFTSSASRDSAPPVADTFCSFNGGPVALPGSSSSSSRTTTASSCTPRSRAFFSCSRSSLSCSFFAVTMSLRSMPLAADESFSWARQGPCDPAPALASTERRRAALFWRASSAARAASARSRSIASACSRSFACASSTSWRR
mmetsp:Transcript_18680/g.46660  ORF Transcript_18680/g.46660 Transcript_18680/m.46660 type:complete len:248 (-) Transcript_18680:23-766(-)